MGCHDHISGRCWLRPRVGVRMGQKQPTRLERFMREYARPQSEVALQIEREVFGFSVNSNGYVTLDQAEELGRRLGLRRGVHLLELGSGLGWPAIHLVERYGCRTTMTDVPIHAMRASAARAEGQGVGDRCAFTVANGVALPFRTRSFDAVTHTDVLC